MGNEDILHKFPSKNGLLAEFVGELIQKVKETVRTDCTHDLLYDAYCIFAAFAHH